MSLLPETSTVFVGDSREVLRGFADNTFHACVTDPPYELGFMGKKWDSSGIAFDVGLWREVFRVMKPGAHLLAFGGTRTSHRMVCAIEDAGFDIRDSLAWIYGQGFPKSLNVTKAMDKADGLRGEVVGQKSVDIGMQGGEMHAGRKSAVVLQDVLSAASAAWEGWGTALKPAVEPICLARKPLIGTVVENVRAHGCGALNIDGCRIGTDGGTRRDGKADKPNAAGWENMKGYGIAVLASGRWPANVLLDEEAARMMDAQSGELTSGRMEPHHAPDRSKNGAIYGKYSGLREAAAAISGDTGGASRFFYCAKASTGEREAGLREAGLREAAAGVGALRDGGRESSARLNTHATVKPVALMEWLLRLVSPPGAHILDPFAGSGTTLVAAKRLCITATGIELDPGHAEIIRGRLSFP